MDSEDYMSIKKHGTNMLAKRLLADKGNSDLLGLFAWMAENATEEGELLFIGEAELEAEEDLGPQVGGQLERLAELGLIGWVDDPDNPGWDVGPLGFIAESDAGGEDAQAVREALRAAKEAGY